MNAAAPECQPKALELRQDCPTPWQVAFAKHGNMTVIHGGQDHDGWQRVALVYSEKDAAFIVACVNSHASLKADNEQLRKALRHARGFIDPDSDPPRTSNREMVAIIDAALSPSTPEVTG